MEKVGRERVLDREECGNVDGVVKRMEWDGNEEQPSDSIQKSPKKQHLPA